MGKNCGGWYTPRGAKGRSHRWMLQTSPPGREEEEEERGFPPSRCRARGRDRCGGGSGPRPGAAAKRGRRDTGRAGAMRHLARIKRRAAANARERDRTHSVNTAFGALRRLIPTRPADRRLSKVETLRLASSYISHLANVLLLQQRRQDEAAAAEQPCPQPCPQPAQPCPQPSQHSQYSQPSHPAQPCSPPGACAPRSICTFCLSDQRQRHREKEKASPGPAVTGL
ncbi:transcription factor 15-like [Catharus ustulatus]|uniref:transcription factor 15-like n=1 Tax=Catharus ustulatus TaxID=91951 RepID=UPI001408D9A8|nr:transcription factor 15-like [Catharus ustulatus]